MSISINFSEERDRIETGLAPDSLEFLANVKNTITPTVAPIILEAVGQMNLYDFLSAYQGEEPQLQMAGDILASRNGHAFSNVVDVDKFHARTLDIVRCILRGEPITEVAEMTSTSVPVVNMPPMPPSVPADDVKVRKLAKTTDKRESKRYDCSQCPAGAFNADGISDLYLHLFNEHDGYTKDNAARQLKALGHAAFQNRPMPTTSHQPVQAPVGKPMFTPKYMLDISSVPDGRFAAVHPITGKTEFIRKVTLKRGYTRRGRYNWGRTTRTWETIPAGTVEVREQTGDTKKLFGEVREGVYYGEQEEIMKLIVEDPMAAGFLYAELMKRCFYCGKSLTDEDSRKRKIGPECWDSKHVPYIMAERERKIAQADAEEMLS